MKRLTKKEEIIMDKFWDNGPMYIKQLQELYPQPRPHFNTLSTQVRTLESNGYVKHNQISGSFQYYPAFSRQEYSEKSLDSLIGKCFANSYLSAVSALVRDEKISLEELKGLIEQIENGKEQ
ncbi:MAG: BlaI/MecI/CopY family transcriptional regulator [Bacteroidetes bacterium]|nr:BlaI/MecI/CopY family transcriptional regulator [Candidatus Colenecus caballi]